MIWYFFAIFENRQVSANQVQYICMILVAHMRDARVVKFFITEPLNMTVVFENLDSLPFSSKNNRQKENFNEKNILNLFRPQSG